MIGCDPGRARHDEGARVRPPAGAVVRRVVDAGLGRRRRDIDEVHDPPGVEDGLVEVVGRPPARRADGRGLAHVERLDDPHDFLGGAEAPVPVDHPVVERRALAVEVGDGDGRCRGVRRPVDEGLLAAGEREDRQSIDDLVGVLVRAVEDQVAGQIALVAEQVHLRHGFQGVDVGVEGGAVDRVDGPVLTRQPSEKAPARGQGEAGGNLGVDEEDEEILLRRVAAHELAGDDETPILVEVRVAVRVEVGIADEIAEGRLEAVGDVVAVRIARQPDGEGRGAWRRHGERRRPATVPGGQHVADQREVGSVGPGIGGLAAYHRRAEVRARTRIGRRGLQGDHRARQPVNLQRDRFPRHAARDGVDGDLREIAIGHVEVALHNGQRDRRSLGRGANGQGRPERRPDTEPDPGRHRRCA